MDGDNSSAARESGTHEGQSYKNPKDGLEEQLAKIWSEALKVEPIGRHDNFFELGGQSALALTLLEKVAERWSVQLPFTAVLRCPTIHEMADLVARRLAAAGDPSKAEQMEVEDGIP